MYLLYCRNYWCMFPSLPFPALCSIHDTVPSWVDYISVFISVPHSSASRRSSLISIKHNGVIAVVFELCLKVWKYNRKCSSVLLYFSFFCQFFVSLKKKKNKEKMCRRSIIWISTLLLLLTLCVGRAIGLYETAPHIVVIMADDLVRLQLNFE